MEVQEALEKERVEKQAVDGEVSRLKVKLEAMKSTQMELRASLDSKVKEATEIQTELIELLLSLRRWRRDGRL
ncbi:hypothetical protein Dimus_033120 [Dionaea muscipula]